MQIHGRECPISGSKRRVLRSCARKTPFKTLSDAERAALLATTTTGEMIVTYRCEFFDHFHIGHLPKSVSKAAETDHPDEHEENNL
jgi:hypothetical protein